MNYTYPEDVFITYSNKQSDLHVRVYLNRVLSANENRPTDPSDTNSWKNTNVIADQIDGSVTREPLIIAKQTTLDKGFRGVKYFDYILVLKDLDIGYYNYIIEAREADTFEGRKRIIGRLIEEKTGEFLVSPSPFDRVICVGNDQDGKPIYKSLTEVLLTTYRVIALNSTVNGVYGDTALVIKATNLKEGEKLNVTMMKGDPELMKNGYSKDVSVHNGFARIENAPEGKYKVTIKSTGEYKIYNHPEDC